MAKLLDDRFPQLRADYALMNPPFNIRNWHPEPLPDKRCVTTSIPACLFILSRNGRDGEHRERLREIRCLDARKLGHLVTRRLRAFSDADIARIADTYHQWRNLNGSYTNTEGFCKAASLAELEANNFVLSPGRYVGSEAEETDGVPFEEKMQQLTAQLAAQFEESAV